VTRPVVPELSDSTGRTLRVPPDDNVPVTPRFLELLDAPEVQRLRTIPQLGFVRFAFPGATHTRLEHSIGVFALGRRALQGLIDRGALAADEDAAALFLLGCLLHDVGHYPFSHVIEDLAALPHLRKRIAAFHHEAVGEDILQDGATGVASTLRTAFGLDPARLVALLRGRLRSEPRFALVSHLLAGPLDVDKMDYLDRDSLHCGVPYGRAFDRQRLLASLCASENGREIAVTEKGKASAEAFLFGRYVMFTEVYWHHTVRAFMAMLKRAVLELVEETDFSPERLVGPAGGAGSALGSDEDRALVEIEEAALRHRAAAAAEILAGIRTGRRGLYRRVLALRAHPGRRDPDGGEDSAARSILVERWSSPSPRGAEHDLARALSRATGLEIRGHDVLVDLALRKDPGADFEVSFPQRAEGRRAERIVDVSPVARALYEEFDAAAKAVRVFAHPRLRGRLRGDVVRRAILSL
jgi:HD superfamily phosphohydrolase